MVELRLDEVAAKMGGQIVQGDPARIFRRFNIDSRLTEPGELFFAIKARRDGHDFIADAWRMGARGAVITHDVSPPAGDFGLVRVPDTLAAIQELARTVLVDHPVKVVAITGSIGKTTTKELAAALLSSRFRVLKSEANFNNSLGVALSVLRLEPEHGVAVLEMGTSGFGELLSLTRIAPPDIAVITNVNPVHLESFHSLEGIARAKKEILEGTRAAGVAVLNGDDPWVRTIGQEWKGRRLTFGLSEGCDIRAASVERLGPEGMALELRAGRKKAKIRFGFLYEDYIYNLLGAVGVCVALALPLDQVAGMIPRLRPLADRGNLVRLGRGVRLVDDSYNSNPRALEGALRGLAALPAKRRVAVLGDMLELGESEVEFHRTAGRQVVEYGWNMLVAVGPLGRCIAEGARAAGMDPEAVEHFDSAEEASSRISSLVRDGDLVLVKGSHNVHLERLVEELRRSLKET
jgi:UDP-N-acetylmuramoyl-tripeptide--D-alanyl-D-alanine ligase